MTRFSLDIREEFVLNIAIDVLLIAGVPLNGPVARYGPFVMNKPEEIFQAIEDHSNGKMGQINF